VRTLPDLQLSVIIPTVGRPTLRRTIDSLLLQVVPGPFAWEGLLVGDTYDHTWDEGLPLARVLAAEHPRLRYVEHDGGVHAWGHPQRNYGATVARGRHLAWLGDDDLYLPGAFAAIAGAIARQREPGVFLFRWISPWKHVLWHTAGFLGDEPGHIDAECIVCPNVPDRLGTWRNRYQGDYDFIRETIGNWGGLERVAWCPEVIAQAQPGEGEDWTCRAPEARRARPLHAGEDVDVIWQGVLSPARRPVPQEQEGMAR
jgi:Glycosyl transferase family 2